MKKIIIVCLCIGLGINLNAQITKILFLGNSYTSVNNLPNTLQQLALSLGDSIAVTMYAPGGYRLMNHAADASSYTYIISTDWDFVVLQAQSQEPSWPPSQVNVEVYPYAVQLNDSIKANNSCTETVFYMTWGRKYGDASNCAAWPPVCTYQGMQERLMVGYMTMAELTGGTVAPCGLAWMNVINNNPTMELYSTDYSHPVETGTYLNACVMYATILRKSPIGATYIGNLGQADAEYLQNIADSTVFSDSYQHYFPDTVTNDTFLLNNHSWFEKGNIVFSDYSYTENTPGEYYFTDNSLNATSFYWDFDDGNNSVLQDPVHSYTTSMTYQVMHISENSCFSDTSYKQLQAIVYVEDINELLLSLYPNPATKTININGINEDCNYTLYSMSGEKISTGTLNRGKNKIYLPKLNDHFIILCISTGKSEFRKKIILN